MVSRKQLRLVLFVFFLPLLGLSARSAEAADSRPNFLFIFADDQCHETVRARGLTDIDTPNLDRLSVSGMTFTRAYNMGSWTGAVCIASRTMLNTGRFLWNAHRVSQDCEKERQAGRFWSEHLKRLGYETYMAGKWHIRADASKAFDHVGHVRPGMPNQTPQGYNRPQEGKPDPWSPWDRELGGFWKGGKHWSEVLGDEACGFLERASRRESPFFMYLAFNAPHDPRQSPREYVERYPLERVRLPENFLVEYPYKEAIGCGKGLRDERLAPFPRTPHAVRIHRQEYYSIITHMDAQVGRILDALEASGKANNTWIFFTADHGLAVGHHGLMGKQNLFDHSVRVPFIVRGPGVTADRRNDTPIYLQDVMPTTLELAGLKVPDHVQFKSLVPLLGGEEAAHYPAIYGAYLDVQRMVTEGHLKLLLYPRIGKVLLYDLAGDPREMHNLADDADHRATRRRLFARLLGLQRQTGDTLDLEAAFPEI